MGKNMKIRISKPELKQVKQSMSKVSQPLFRNVVKREDKNNLPEEEFLIILSCKPVKTDMTVGDINVNLRAGDFTYSLHKGG